MTYTPQWLTRITQNIAAAVTDHQTAHPGKLSRFVGWMGAETFAAKCDGRAQWKACELLLLAREMGVRPSELVDGRF